MYSPPRLSWLLCTIGLLQRASAQSYQSALMFQGKGLVGSVIDATGCDITYELECTAGTSVCSDVIKTVTMSGSTSYFMSYAAISTTASGDMSYGVSDKCKLRSTTVAYCTATASVVVGSLSTASTDTFAVTEEGVLGYAQVPITAGPEAALRSVSSCSVSGAATSSPYSSSASQGPTITDIASSVSASSTSTAVAPASGLSTGAKAGIGAGAGVGALAILATLGALLWYRKRRQRTAPATQESNLGTVHTYDQPPPSYSQQGPYEFEQPAAKYEMSARQEVQELPGHHRQYELPAAGR